ncbi:MAG: mannose-1-phosphate guanylyltransferase [Melioribacteraceae bacterium]|nr:MAG: mannose-1-phosphate guanylyltransferase [Melioribacteraceae bacterium]
MEKFVVIMAGGVGSRFWPRSRKTMPKQLLNIFGENTMIQDTVFRLKDFISVENIYIVTNKVQKAIIEEQLPELNPNQVIAEPVGRNTAPCVGLSALLIKARSQDAVIVTLPADHIIRNIESFTATLNNACEFAYENKCLVTFGINPSRPDTGYGYINTAELVKNDVYKVHKFVEKPDLPTAEKYIKSGDYLWNSGMFVWRADVIYDEIKSHLPALHSGLESLSSHMNGSNFLNALKDTFPGFESISIDYGIMEKSDKVFCAKADFGWSDVGSWETVYELTDKDEQTNAKVGDVYVEDVNDSYIYSPDKFTAAIGVNNLVIINMEDSLLICDRTKVQDVRNIVDHLNKENREDLI